MGGWNVIKINTVTSKNDIEESEALSIVSHLVPIETFVAASPSFVLEQDIHDFIDDTHIWFNTIQCYT